MSAAEVQVSLSAITMCPGESLVRIQYRGFYIRAMHFFNPEVVGWKARAFVWKHAGIPVEHFVDDPTGAIFSTREHAIHASLFLGRKWVEQHT